MRSHFETDLYLVNMMLDHVRLVKKTIGQEISDDYMVFLEHISFHFAYQLADISEQTKQSFPDFNWRCIDQLYDYVKYEVYHFKLGDVIETISDDMAILSDELTVLRNRLVEQLECERT